MPTETALRIFYPFKYYPHTWLQLPFYIQYEQTEGLLVIGNKDKNESSTWDLTQHTQLETEDDFLQLIVDFQRQHVGSD